MINVEKKKNFFWLERKKAKKKNSQLIYFLTISYYLAAYKIVFILEFLNAFFNRI